MKKILVLFVLAAAGLGVMPAAQATVVYSAGPAAVIAGSGEVGKLLTVATPGEWSPEPDTRTYEWLVNGEGAVVGTGTSYTPLSSQVGEELWLVETATWTDEDGTQVDKNTSTPVEVVPSTLKAPGVKVTGTARVGRTLTASYTSAGTGDDLTQEWTRDGVGIPGATSETYVVDRTDAGHVIRFRTTSTTDDGGYLQKSTSALRIPAFNTSVPRISGTFKVGRRITLAGKGTWYGDGYSYKTYRWLRNGAAISKATGTTYKLTSKDKGKRISLRVTATKKDYASVNATSAASAKVRK